MTKFVFAPQPQPALAVVGSDERIPVSRLFCVGRNYEDHAKEMGMAVDRAQPFYFTKSAFAVVETGSTIPYAPATSNFHYELELVVVIGAPAFRVSKEDALGRVYGYACGLDMTRRDIQLAARAKQLPWDLGKDIEYGAPVSPVVPAARFGVPTKQKIKLRQNGVTRQSADLSQLVWSVPELIAHLSHFYHLRPGDLIFTGTPAGVGPVKPGDVLEGTIEGVGELTITIGPAE